MCKYKAKNGPHKGQSLETGSLKYGIFFYAHPQERKRFTRNKVTVNPTSSH